MGVFVSHDGDGTEVYVTTAKGKVTDIEERTSSANVKIEASYLKFPLNGWLNTGEEALEILRKAKETGEEVEVRVEAQRKPKIDKSIPIQDIRDSKTANADIIKKIASVNGVFTSEALTNPEDDPDNGRPKSALGRSSAPQSNDGGSVTPSVGKDSVLGLLKNLSTSREVSETIIDALKAQALIAGATVHEIAEASTVDSQQPHNIQNNFSREAPPFKEYNSDGRLNLGGASVAAGVGVFNYVFEKLSKTNLGTDPNIETVEYLSALVLSIADVLQAGAYGKGFRADRTASSHTRVRATLFTVIDINPFPVTANGEVASPDVVNGWVKTVGAVARRNLTSGITVSQQFPSVKALLDQVAVGGGLTEVTPNSHESVSTASESERVAVAPQTVSSPVEKVTEAPAPITEPTVEEIAPEPAPVVEPTSTETYDVGIPGTPNAPTYDVGIPGTPNTPTHDPAFTGTSNAGVSETPAPTRAPEAASTPDDGLVRFEQNLLPPGAINASNAPDEELLSQFKEFVIEETGLKTKAEQAKVGRLLAYTFGRAYNKASNIPADDLADFLDFYVSTGVDNFKAVLDTL